MTTLALTTLLAFGAQAPDPKEILREIIAAGKKVHTVRYELKGDHYGLSYTATVVEKRANVAGGGRVIKSVYGVSVQPDQGPTMRYAYDGKAFRLQIGDEAIQLLENPKDYEIGQIMGQHPSPELPMFTDFLEPILTSGKLKYLGRKTIGAFDCDVLEIRRTLNHPTMGESEHTSVTAFDRATRLPIQTGSKTVTKLQVNPDLPAAAFTISGKLEEIPTSSSKVLAADLLPEGTKAPDFTLKDGADKTLKLSELRGKVVLLDFWGTWCVPCHQMMPKLQKLHDQYGKKGLVVIGVAVADRELDPVQFMKKKGFTYRIAPKGDTVAKQYKAKLLPTLYVIDKSGKIVYRQAGLDRNSDGKLESLIARLSR